MKLEYFNEYCLAYIFSYLEPKDWLNINKVCRRWKFIVSRLWKIPTELKLTTINCTECIYHILSAAELIELMRSCGENIKNLKLQDSTFNIQLEPYTYIWSFVTQIVPSKCLFQINLNSYTYISLCEPQIVLENLSCFRPETLKLCSINFDEIARFLDFNNLTITLKELKLDYVVIKDFGNFESILSALTLLRKFRTSQYLDYDYRILPKVCENVPELTSLCCNYYSRFGPIDENAFITISNLKHLEELTITKLHAKIEKTIDLIVCNCRELKIVRIEIILRVISKRAMEALLSLPNLQSLYIDSSAMITNQLILQSPVTSLNNLYLFMYYGEHFDVNVMFNWLNKMPALLNLCFEYCQMYKLERLELKTKKTRSIILSKPNRKDVCIKVYQDINDKRDEFHLIIEQTAGFAEHLGYKYKII